MTDTQYEGLSIESESLEDYETKKYDCYGIRLSKNKEKVMITINNKNVETFARSDFPNTLDFNNLDQIIQMISLLRKNGVAAIISAYNLPIS